MYNVLMTNSNHLSSSECLDYSMRDPYACAGSVEVRDSMSPTGARFVRCQKHYIARLDSQRRIVRDYGGQMFYDGPEADDPYDY